MSDLSPSFEVVADSDSLWQQTNDFCSPFRVTDRERSSDEREAEWNAVYDAIVAELSEIGKFSEGGLGGDADFSSSRWVPPSRNIVFTLDSPEAFDPRTVRAVLRVLHSAAAPFAVTFDFEGGYVSMFPDGRVIGHSEFPEALQHLGFPAFLQ